MSYYKIKADWQKEYTELDRDEYIAIETMFFGGKVLSSRYSDNKQGGFRCPPFHGVFDTSTMTSRAIEKYDKFPFNEFNIFEIAHMIKESRALGDEEFVTACLLELRKRQRSN